MPQSSTSKQKTVAREREQRAFELRKAGASYAQIGRELGIAKQNAHKAVQRVLASLAKLTEVDAEQVRTLEVARLDALLIGLWDRARRGDDAAVDRALKIMTRRAELLGLDAPKQTMNLGANGEPVEAIQVVLVKPSGDSSDSNTP